jgi:hypothetical protein
MGWLTNKAKQSEIQVSDEACSHYAKSRRKEMISEFLRNINACYKTSEEKAISFTKLNYNTTDAYTYIFKYRDILELCSSGLLRGESLKSRNRYLEQSL